MVDVSIIGAGYVGLVTGVGLALKGNNVICVEKVRQKINSIKNGKSTIYEKDLDFKIQKILSPYYY